MYFQVRRLCPKKRFTVHDDVRLIVVQEVNQLLKQFNMMQKMMKQFNRLGKLGKLGNGMMPF